MVELARCNEDRGACFGRTTLTSGSYTLSRGVVLFLFFVLFVRDRRTADRMDRGPSMVQVDATAMIDMRATVDFYSPHIHFKNIFCGWWLDEKRQLESLFRDYARCRPVNLHKALLWMAGLSRMDLLDVLSVEWYV